MKNDRFISKRRFLEITLRDFLRKSAKEGNTQEELKGIYDGYKKLLENQLIISGDKSKEIQELYAILDKVYKLFLDKDARERLANSNLKVDTIIEKYGEKILGDNKRTYKMNKLFNEQLIGTTRDGNNSRVCVKYVPRVNENNSGVTEYVFKLEDGKIVTISLVGEIVYKTAFGVNKYINKYVINRQVSESTFESNEVFTSIAINNMENPEYRDVVLSELLGENNVSLSETGGYVGTISHANNELKPGEESFQGMSYTYRINDKYSIEYDADDVTAVMLYQKEKEKKLKNNQEFDQEER